MLRSKYVYRIAEGGPNLVFRNADFTVKDEKRIVDYRADVRRERNILSA